MFRGVRALAREHIYRIEESRFPTAIHADYGAGRRVIARAVVIDGILILGRVYFRAAQNVCLPEEGGHPPDLFPLPLAQPYVDLLQVAGAVMAGSATDVHAQEILCCM